MVHLQKSISHKKAHKTQNELKILILIKTDFVPCVPFCGKNKYASGVSVDVNGIAMRAGPAIL